MTTKSIIKAKIKLAMSMIEAANNIIANIRNDIDTKDVDDFFLDWRNDMFDGEFGDNADLAFADIADAGLLDNMNEGDEAPKPTVDVEYGLYPTINIPVDGGALEVYMSQSDFGTYQAGIIYKCQDSIFDLALAEVKRGELARIKGLPEDNKDISLFVYGNPAQEDYTDCIQISYDEIKCIADDEA